MRLRWLALLAFFLIAWPVWGEVPRAGTILVRSVESSSPGSSYLRLEPEAKGYRELQSKQFATVVDFPLTPALKVDLELQAFDVLTPGARMIAVDDDGEHELPFPEFRVFRGAVRGDADSRVTLSLFNNRLSGTIRTSTEEFVVGARPGVEDGSPSLAVWSPADDPDQPDGPLCDGDVHAPIPVASYPGAERAPITAAAVSGGSLLEARVAIDATYEWYSHFGSLEAAQGYILDLMAQVSQIYEDEVGVVIQVPYLRVFTTPADPYAGGTNTSALLSELRTEWNANQTGVDRTVAHLFSRRTSGGAGIAYVDVLCNHTFSPGNSYDYGVSTLTANGGSWEKRLVAHELGHNFSSPHTHCYSPEIDQCANQTGCYSGPVHESVGTIMSYCNTSTTVFHSRVEDQIRPAAEAAYPYCIGEAGVSGLPGTPENLHRTDTLE